VKTTFNEMKGKRPGEMLLEQNEGSLGFQKPGIHQVTDAIMYWSSDSPASVGFQIPKARPRDAKTEAIFEAVRRELNPDAPSRLNCVFVCPIEGSGFCSNSKYSRRAHVYKVKVTGKVFTTDGGLWTEAMMVPKNWSEEDRAESIRSWAKEYWKPRDNVRINMAEEVLVEGTVVIVGEADTSSQEEKDW
jgi:hypothetical protein